MSGDAGIQCSLNEQVNPLTCELQHFYSFQPGNTVFRGGNKKGLRDDDEGLLMKDSPQGELKVHPAGFEPATFGFVMLNLGLFTAFHKN